MTDTPIAIRLPANIDFAAIDSNYEPYIDGLRGMLATYVVLHHIYTVLVFLFAQGYVGDGWRYYDWMTYGHNAVVAFIFVSGLCLGMPVVRSLDTTGLALRRGALHFYAGRAKRILPAYYAAVLICAVICFFLFRSPGMFPEDYFLPIRSPGLLGSLLLGPNLVDKHNGVGVIWSLGVELQIYLCFPLFCAIWQRFGVAVLTCFILVAASCVEAYFPKTWGPIRLVGGAVSGLCPSLYVAFSAGLLAAVLLKRKTAFVTSIRDTVPWGILFLTYIIVLAVRAARWGVIAEVDDYLTAVLMLLLVMTIYRHPRFRWIFERPIPVQLGTFSYSLYLVHLILINVLYIYVYKRIWPASAQTNFSRAFFFELGLGLPLSIGAAYGFARLFEFPFMNNKKRRAAATAYVPPKVASGGAALPTAPLARSAD